MEATRDWFAVRCDDQAAYFQLLKAGLGVGFVATDVALSDKSLEQIFPNLDIPAIDVSLAAHEKTLKTPRVRAIWNALEKNLKPILQ